MHDDVTMGMSCEGICPSMHMHISQLAFASFPHSTITASFALFVGLLHHTEYLPFRHIRVPAVIARCCERVLAPLTTSTAASQGHVLGGARAVTVAGGHAYAAVGGVDDWDAPAAAPVAPITVNATHLSHLVSMGFDHEMARAALMTTRNDLQGAVTLLTTAQTR